MKPTVPQKTRRSALKNAPAEEFRPTLRELYTWHLYPPFKDQFDNEHWWKDQRDDDRPANRRLKAFPADMKGEAVVESVAALYELCRRHPAVFAVRIYPEFFVTRPQFCPLHFLWAYGLKAWPRLHAPLQESWRYLAGSMKGVDARIDAERCWSVEDAAMVAIASRRAFTDKKYQKMLMKKVDRLVGEDMRKSPPLRREIEAEIKRAALLAYRKGDLLLAVSADLASDDAEGLMLKIWKQQRTVKGIFKQRARWQQWLPLISQFENEVTNFRAYPASLTHYRRIFDGVPFPNFFPSPAGKSPKLKADA